MPPRITDELHEPPQTADPELDEGRRNTPVIEHLLIAETQNMCRALITSPSHSHSTISYHKRTQLLT
eukprot:2004532-Pyramimonas_sp.AAC.1